MKKSLAFALSFVLIVGITAVAVYEGPPPVKEDYWDNLPEGWKFNFTTFGQFGASTRSEAEFQIAGYIFTEKSAKHFYEEDWPEPKDWVESILNRLSRPVGVYVYSYGNSTEPFDPTKFTFSQSRNSTEYSVNSDTGIAGFESGEVMMGILNVPSEINAKESFFIHYEYDSSQVYVPTSFTENPFTENDSWEYQEEDTKESDGFPPEDMIEVESIKGSGELIKITVVGESAGGVSGEKVIRGEEGTVDAQVSKVNNYTCEGFVDLEGTVNNSFEFSNAGCNFRGGNVELSSGLMDLGITSETNKISVSITKGGVTRTYLFEGEINVSSG